MTQEERQLESIRTMLETHILTHEADMKLVNEKLDIIFPVVKRDMDNAAFWMKFQEKFKMGGGAVLWIVGVLAALIILTGYGKVVLLTWLGLKGQ